jgi:hypothetical protein
VRYRIFCARFFEFEVGFQQFAVHKSLVSRTSPALYARAKNCMRESQERPASIPDVDDATFARFVEFMYAGDYNSAKLLWNQEAIGSIQGIETDIGKNRLSGQEIAVELEPELPSDAPLATGEPADFDEWGGSGMTKNDKKRTK